MYGVVLGTWQEHKWVGKTVQCWRKLKGSVLLCQRMPWGCLWVTRSSKHFSLASRIYKFCWGTAPCNCNHLVMVHGGHLLINCFLLNSLSKAAQNLIVELWKVMADIISILSPFYLEDILQITFARKWSNKVSILSSPWIGLFFYRKGRDTSMIFGTRVGIFFWNGRKVF